METKVGNIEVSLASCWRPTRSAFSPRLRARPWPLAGARPGAEGGSRNHLRPVTCPANGRYTCTCGANCRLASDNCQLSDQPARPALPAHRQPDTECSCRIRRQFKSFVAVFAEGQTGRERGQQPRREEVVARGRARLSMGAGERSLRPK